MSIDAATSILTHMIDETLMDVLTRIWEHGFATNLIDQDGTWEARATDLVGERAHAATGSSAREAFVALARRMGIAGAF